MAAPIVYKKYASDEEKAKLYNRRLAVADNDFDRWAGLARDWWDRYEGVPKATQATKKGLLVNVPTGTSVIDALFSGLTAIDVEFSVYPAGRTTPEQAILAQTALNAEWAALDVDEERNDAIKDALIVGIGWVKVGYDFFAETRQIPRDREEIAEEVQRLIAEALAAGLEPPTPEQIAALVPSDATVEEALRDRIVVDYVPWDMVRWDPSARRIKDVRWIAQITKMSKDDVVNNPLWREYAKRTRGGLRRLENVSPDTKLEEELLPGGKATNDEQRVTVVEMWDLESGTVCTFVRNQDWLLYESVNPFAMFPDLHDRSPFVPLVLRKTTRRLRGVSEMEVIARSLNEKNLYRSRTATYIERAVPKVLAPEDAFTEEGQRNLTNNEVNAIVSIAANIDPKAVTPMVPPVLPEQAFQMNDRIDNEIREATGVNELMRGLFPDRRRTATETAEVVSASAARQSEKRNTLERFHEEIAKRILHLMMMFYDQPRMVRYVDPSLGDVPWEFSGEDIIGEFVLKVALQPKEAPTRDTLRQEATVALNVLGPLAQPGPDGSSVIDLRTLVAWFMRKYGFTERDINELLNADEEQQAQMARMLGLQAAAAAAGQGAQALMTSEVPPEVAAGAMGGFGPTAPEAVERVSESAGVRA